MPIRTTAQDRLASANSVQQWQRGPGPTAQYTPSLKSVVPTQNGNREAIITQPTSSRARTDTASLAFSRAFAKADATSKGSTPPLPTLSSSAVAESAGYEPVTTGSQEEESVKQSDDDDLQEVGSGSLPTGTLVEDDSPGPLSTVGDEMAQYQPPAQTVISEVTDVKTTPDTLLTTANQISTTSPSARSAILSRVVTQTTPRTVMSTGKNSTALQPLLYDSKLRLKP